MYSKQQLEKLKGELYSGVLADILDEYGIRENVMRNDVRPIQPNMKFLGRALTMLATDVYEVPQEPYKLELEAVDSAKECDVVVVTTNGSVASGFWGELLTTCVQRAGCVGAVIDGCTRDAAQIIKAGFPLFARGYCAYDSKGRTDVIAYNVPVRCGEVLVNPGDYVFGDIDGVVVIPVDIAEEVIEKALGKSRSEDFVRAKISDGVGVNEIFRTYGIL